MVCKWNKISRSFTKPINFPSDYITPIDMCTKVNIVSNKLVSVFVPWYLTIIGYSLFCPRLQSKHFWLFCFCLVDSGFYFWSTFHCWLITLASKFLSYSIHWSCMIRSNKHIRIYLKSYLLDATEIFRTLRKHRDESVTKVGCHIIFFFIYLYFMIGALSSED